MKAFELDVEAVRASRARAAALAESEGVLAAFERAAGGGGSCGEDLVALFLVARAATAACVELARTRRGGGAPHIETFSPLYLTNECDGACKMCGMRADNTELVRETAGDATVDDQLSILHPRGLRGGGLLT